MQPSKFQKGFNFIPYSESDDIDFKVSVIKPNNSSLSDLFNQIDTEADTFKDGMTALLDAVEEDRWATDPLNLMPLFSVTDWRERLSDWLISLSIWIDPD